MDLKGFYSIYTVAQTSTKSGTVQMRALLDGIDGRIIICVLKYGGKNLLNLILIFHGSKLYTY